MDVDRPTDAYFRHSYLAGWHTFPLLYVQVGVVLNKLHIFEGKKSGICCAHDFKGMTIKKASTNYGLNGRGCCSQAPVFRRLYVLCIL